MPSPPSRKARRPRRSREDHAPVVAAHWWPFVIAVLGEGPLPKAHGAVTLPLGRPQIFTQELLAALQQVLPRAVGAMLCQRGGWRPRPYPAGGEFATGRVWNVPLATLQFTPHTLETLLVLFNAGVRRQIAVPDHLVAPPTANGDLLLGYTLLRRYACGSTPCPTETLSLGWAAQPLGLMAHAGLLPQLPVDWRQRLERLWQDDLLALLPWLGLDWPAAWAQDLSASLDGDLETAARFGVHQRQLWSHWSSLATDRGRWDLLLPWLDYFTTWNDERCEAYRRAIDQLIRPWTLSQRQPFIAHILEGLAPAMALEQFYRRGQATHPVDRSADVKLFMHYYRQGGFETALRDLRRLSQRLQPTLG